MKPKTVDENTKHNCMIWKGVFSDQASQMKMSLMTECAL